MSNSGEFELPLDPDQVPDFDPGELATEATEHPVDVGFASGVFRAALTWPLGKRGREVVVVLGEEDARRVAAYLENDPDVDLGSVAIVGISGFRNVPPEHVALEVRAAAFPDAPVWFLAPESDQADLYWAGLSIALLDAGLSEAQYVPLGPDGLTAIADTGESDEGPEVDYSRVFGGG